MSYFESFGEAISLIRSGYGIKNDHGELIAVVRDEATAKLLIEAAGVADVGPYAATQGRETIKALQPKLAELLNQMKEASDSVSIVLKDLNEGEIRLAHASEVIQAALDNFTEED